MAPTRVRAEDPRSENSVATTKPLTGTANAGISKAKKAPNATHVGSNLKDVQSVGDGVSSNEAALGVNWTAVPTRILHAYRHAYKVDTPPAFASFETMLSLTNPEGLGKFSPTMARRKDKRRVSKDVLAMAVRKDFNAAAVNEPEVLTSFLYAVKNQNKPFRMRFTAGKIKQ